MEKLKDNIIKSRDIKTTSLNTYLCALRKLKKTIDPKNPILEDTKYLQDFDKVMEAIHKENKLTSKKNKLTAILVALNSDDPKNQPLIDKYNNELKTLGEKYLSFLRQQVKTDTQKKNWLSYDELIKIVNKVMKQVRDREIHKKKEGETLTKKEFDILQQYIILRTYLTFPLRNDFADMKILKLKDYKNIPKDEMENNNFLVLLSNNKKQFYINQFKNKKYIGSKILDVPQKLNRVINLWLRFNKSGYYLVKSDGKTPMTPNAITKFLNKIFVRNANGKKISSSMIRHIVISYMMKDEKTIKQKDEEAKAIENKFFHSKNINELYRKIDENPQEETHV